MGFRQAKWDEPLIYELGAPGRIGFLVPEVEEEVRREVGQVKVPEKIRRKKDPELPEVSEVEVVRHYIRLSQMSYGVDNGPVPLGSCTMKYNPKIGLEVAMDERVVWLHPLQDERTVQGLLEAMYLLQRWLCNITGMDACTLHPAAGAHGELAGALIIRRYHELKGQLDKKKEIIVPDSAHGTNPASSAMAGFKVVTIRSDERGNVDVEALKAALSERTAGLMLTNPNTLGLFEENILEIAELVHEVDGLLYYDGANLNGIMGYTRPGDMGFDIAHLNVHKTFGAPHGGGGPGAGPVCVKDRVVNEEENIRLADLLPGPIVVYDERERMYKLKWPGKYSVGMLKGFFANTVPLMWCFVYILSLGSEGLRKVTEQAVINTNYFVSLLKGVRGYTLPYNPERPRKHEVVVSAEKMSSETGVNAEDVAKGLLDAGFYAPTIYFPLIVHEALMVEFTESETKENIDNYARKMREIAEVAYTKTDKAKKWPLNTSKGRVDLVRANHPKFVTPTWRVYRLREKGEVKGLR